MTNITRSVLVSLALGGVLPAQEIISAPLPGTVAAVIPSVEKATSAEPVANDTFSSVSESQERGSLAKSASKSEPDLLDQETSAMRAEIARLKAERDLITERLSLEAAQRQAQFRAEMAKLETEKEALQREGELSRLRAEKFANELKTMQNQAALELTRLQNEISRIETAEKRSQYADATPEYLEKPLRDDGVVVISDRRIPLNGMITASTADFVTNRIHYWNNKDSKLPIFIVIDDCPGGSVMAGYRILKSMESSKAPIHVVVKSFAASMAACITTLAEESYAYPNAIILHHQISSSLTFARLNLTQQREFFEESQRWWERLATPVAEKMGISTDEFIKQMYAHSTSGDWSEFGDRALELKWVNHIVQGIEETSFNKDPDFVEKAKPAAPTACTEEIDAEGKPFAWLPRLNPKDCYFLYNPDGYFRMR
jgi:ATP-dependent Clp protease, protease subunit